VIAALILLGTSSNTVIAQVSYDTLGSTYSQNFDNLLSPVPADNATTNGSVLPTGWSFVESDTSADTNLRIGTGSSSTGDTYLFGATGSNERALGSLASGSLASQYGLQLVNNSGATITSFMITYDGEQWRDGGSATSVTNTLKFSYSIGAISLTSGTYVNDTALNFTAVTNNLTGNLSTDGNSISFRTAGITDTISDVTWADGQSLWLRWIDTDETGNDDGLAIDNFSFVAPIPEPSTFTLVGMGAALLLGLRRKKK
jgi:hypothetical protein